MKKTLVLALVQVLGLTVSGWALGAGEEQIGLICRIQIQDNNKAYISPCDGWTTKNGCLHTGPWITWKVDNEAGKLMYSTALSAYAANKPVMIRLDGSLCDGYDVTRMIRAQ